MTLRHCLLAALSASACAVAQANLSYDFDTGPQGFTISGDGLLTHQTDAGNGYLQIEDTNGSTDVYLEFPLNAPVVDWSAYLGGTLSFDGIMLNGIMPSWPTFGTVTFTAQSGQWVSADLAAADQPLATWSTYSAALTPAVFAGTGSLGAVLSQLSRVSINLEAGNGPFEVVGIDNIVLASPVPEPSTWMLGGMGLAAMALLRRRRR